jgi:hypothetical protein
MTRTVTDVNAAIDGGRIVKMTFNAVVQDDAGGHAAMPITTTGPFPILANDPSPADLEAIALEIAGDDAGMFPYLEAQLAARAATPAPPPVSPAPPPAVTEAEQRQLWMKEVDDTIAAIITHVTRFQIGYELREAAALAYKQGGYRGTPSIWVVGYAQNYQLDYRTAANIILTQAAGMRDALEQLDAVQRMRKYSIANAATFEEARAIFLDILANVRTIQQAIP